ncbi:hypothetical protein, partial [Chromobacterium amazonense]
YCRCSSWPPLLASIEWPCPPPPWPTRTAKASLIDLPGVGERQSKEADYARLRESISGLRETIKETAKTILRETWTTISSRVENWFSKLSGW